MGSTRRSIEHARRFASTRRDLSGEPDTGAAGLN